MAISAENCDEGRITRFLKGELSRREERDFEQHLSDCESCLQRLQRATASAADWRDAAQWLRDEPIDLKPLSGLSSDSTSQELTREVIDDGVRRVLELLAPTDDPHMLGRLGSYEIAGVVGSGGNGIVLKGYDRALNRYVAIKVLAPHLASSGAARKRFAREAQAAAVVVHENVIAIHSVAEFAGLPFLVMPYVRGTSLQRRLDEQGPLELIEILRVGMQVAAGLAAAHAQGLVHRDIKPANILLADGIERVTITDFGLARAIDDVSMTRSGLIAGTPQFMSPEQANGDSIDHRSDLFSLGSVLYAMCTGHPPFRAETSLGILRRICESTARPIGDLRPEIPSWLCRLIAKLHRKDAAGRFQSAAEVSALLSQCLAHVQQPARQSLPKVLRRGPSWHGWRWGVAIGVTLGLAALAWLAAVAWYQQTKPTTAPTADMSPSTVSVEPSQSAGVLASNKPVTADLRWDDDVSAEILDIGHDIEQLEQRAAHQFSDPEQNHPNP